MVSSVWMHMVAHPHPHKKRTQKIPTISFTMWVWTLEASLPTINFSLGCDEGGLVWWLNPPETNPHCSFIVSKLRYVVIMNIMVWTLNNCLWTILDPISKRSKNQDVSTCGTVLPQLQNIKRSLWCQIELVRCEDTWNRVHCMVTTPFEVSSGIADIVLAWQTSLPVSLSICGTATYARATSEIFFSNLIWPLGTLVVLGLVQQSKADNAKISKDDALKECISHSQFSYYIMYVSLL